MENGSCSFFLTEHAFCSLMSKFLSSVRGEKCGLGRSGSGTVFFPDCNLVWVEVVKGGISSPAVARSSPDDCADGAEASAPPQPRAFVAACWHACMHVCMVKRRAKSKVPTCARRLDLFSLEASAVVSLSAPLAAVHLRSCAPLSGRTRVTHAARNPSEEQASGQQTVLVK